MTASRHGTLNLNTVSPRTATPVRSAARRRDRSAGSGASCAADEPHVADRVPHVYCELDLPPAPELSVATVLSAQCADVRVNRVTPALFAAISRRPRLRRGADRTELGEMIRSPASTGTRPARSSASVRRSSAGSAAVPDNPRRSGLPCPGFGHRPPTSSSAAPGVPSITVGTHFGRLVRRWRWTAETDQSGRTGRRQSSS